jgi:para-nitrobenzyl esterase
MNVGMNSRPVAQVALGALRGVAEGDVAVFRGVPYAAPPVGGLRFLPPRPPRPWSGVRDAGHHGPIAPQLRMSIVHVMGDVLSPQGEDCLTLTIWTPATDERRRPVLVFLHGGSFTSGAGSLDWYNGSRLARDGDMVVVGVNYRLGALGFLCQEGVCDGNLGLLDQAAALGWVAANIEAFGGDPDRVTVAGQSAGAHAIPRLVELANSRPPFRRAILQSGSFFRPVSTREDMAPTSSVFLRALGIEPGSIDALSRLQDVPVDRILQAQVLALQEGERLGDTKEAFRPVSPSSAPAAERIPAIAKALSGIDVMLGITANEMHAFIGRPELPDHTESLAAERLQAITGRANALAYYQARYPGSTLRNLLCEVTTEHAYCGPTTELADGLAASGVPVFGYVFAWAPPGSRYKACHCIELPFLFGNFEMWPNAGMLDGGDADEMAALSATIQRAWITFVHRGEPEPDKLISWPRYVPAERQVIRFGNRIAVGRSYFI